MSCYFRHMSDILKEAGIEITPGNKREVDRLIHSIVGIDYKNCSSVWKAVKGHKTDEALRAVFVKKLKKGLPGLAKKS